MSRLRQAFQYLAGVIVFIFGYGVANFIAHVIITARNTDLHWSLASYVVPYFVAIMAGCLGVVGGVTILDWLFPNTPKRPIVWAFVGLMVVIWLFVVFGLVIGVEADPGTTAMAVQALAAVVTAFKLTRSDRFESSG